MRAAHRYLFILLNHDWRTSAAKISFEIPNFTIDAYTIPS